MKQLFSQLHNFNNETIEKIVYSFYSKKQSLEILNVYHHIVDKRKKQKVNLNYLMSEEHLSEVIDKTMKELQLII